MKTSNTMKTAFLTAALCAAAASKGATEDDVSLRLSSAFATAPATVIVTATVLRDERNRALVVTAESDDFFRSSTVELDGENEARVHQFWLKELPEGHYVVTAQLEGVNGVRALGTAPLDVHG